MLLVAEIVMLERDLTTKVLYMEQLACQVHAVLVVQSHQLKLTNNPFIVLAIDSHLCVVYII